MEKETKNIIIASVLSLAVLYAFRSVFTPPAPPPDPAPIQIEQQSTKTTLPPAVNEPAAPPAQAPLTSVPAADIQADGPKDHTTETALYSATISNVGGVLKSFRLKAYTDGEGKPLELINQEVRAKVGSPLAIVTGDKELDDRLAAAWFVDRPEGDRLTLEFAAGGIHAVKILEFNRTSYEVSIQTTLTRDGKSVLHAVAWQGDFGDQSIPFNATTRNAVYQAGAAFERINLPGISEPADLSSIKAGVEDQYFLAMFLLPDAASAVKVLKKEYPGPEGEAVPTLFLTVAAQEGRAARVYVGPKQREFLAQADPGLVAVIDYGWFDFIAKPLIVGLLWIHSYIGNFGWAIVILTLAINLVLFPLRLKQQVSMQKMAKIQPQMRRLQDQYKKLKPTDPRRAQVQSDMMGLYKEHGVNPMGGCLPLLLQMPVLFGFYNALNYSIELRRAPWILWIKDLSVYDPYFVLPILMALSMILMTKLTPTTVDPAQAKMMMIMPVMMTVLFIYQSAGLVLYWLMSNVAGIGQQVFINKYWSPQVEQKPPKRSGKDPEK